MPVYQLGDVGALPNRYTLHLNYEENYIMNLTSDTIAVLKNFSDINQNILVMPWQYYSDYLYIEKHFG